MQTYMVLALTLLLFSALAAEKEEEPFSGLETNTQMRSVERRLATLEKGLEKLSAQVNFLTSGMEEVMKYIKKEKLIENQNTNNLNSAMVSSMNDTDLEERVTVLEFQMEGVNEDIMVINDEITALNDDVTALDADVRDLSEDVEAQITIIQADQVVQDERLLDVEDDVEAVLESVDAIEGSVVVLEESNADLNSSLTQLYTRLTELEEELNNTIDGILDSIGNVEDSVVVLQQTDSELSQEIDDVNNVVTGIEERLSKLELSGTIAFYAYVGTYTTIPEDSVVLFPNINVNIGNGYNGATGEFTVPSGGAGLYYTYVHFMYNAGRFARFNMRRNGMELCNAIGDEDGGGDYASPSCGAVVVLEEGDVVDVFYDNGTDDLPLYSGNSPRNGFTGFRIAPQ